MQEQVGGVTRLIVDGGAAGASDSPAAPARRLGREAVDMLADIPLFAGLSKRHLTKIAGAAATKRYAPGSALVRVGRPADAFFVILDGGVRVEAPGDAIALGAGDFFGEMALIDGEPRSATVVATGEVFVLTLARAKFLKVLESEPKIALAIMATLTRRLRAVQGAAAAL
jgi:CRP-like cAMP-binding protein